MVPQKLVETTLKTYHVPEQFQKLLQCYFDKFNMRFTCGNFTTDWQRLEVGIVTGCTISLSSTGVQYWKAAFLQAHIRAFMDDLTITAKSVPEGITAKSLSEGTWILEDLVGLTDWARMELKPAKSRSLVLRSGRVQDRFCFKIREDIIPTVQEKSLGKWYKADLNDKQSVKESSFKLKPG